MKRFFPAYNSSPPNDGKFNRFEGRSLPTCAEMITCQAGFHPDPDFAIGLLGAAVPKPDFVKGLAFWQEARGRDLENKQALGLKGGLQVLLASDLPGGAQPTVEQMDAAKRIIEDRVNGLGVAEPIVQAAQDNRILVELPGVTDRNLAIDLIKQTGHLNL